MREHIRNEIAAIVPLDELERRHIAEALAWVDSGAELCRLEKPAVPPVHLVAYAVVVDAGHVLLVDHRNAGLWLPTGGHVEPGEDPRETAVREIQEELGITPAHAIEPPVLITRTTTVGLTAGHTDVSLWYVVRHDRFGDIVLDRGEFNDARWFAAAEVPFDRADPHLARFLAKLGDAFAIGAGAGAQVDEGGVS